MFRSWRLAFALQRLELLLLLSAAVLVVVACLVIAWQTSEVRAAFVACNRAAAPGSDGCHHFPLNDLSFFGGFAKLGALLAPFALGLFLGVPMVAREIEGRTAPIAWTLSRSRRRWLVQRAAPVVVMVVVAAGLVGIASEVLARTSPFGEHAVDLGLIDYGSRGAILPVQALAVLLLAIAMGALVPRQLPALLLAGAVTLALFVALNIGLDAWMAAEAVPIDTDQALARGARIVDTAYRNDATGEVISFNDYYNQFGDIGAPDREGPKGFTEVALGVPGDQYGVWVLREAAILGVVTVASGAIALAMVQRRRPG